MLDRDFRTTVIYQDELKATDERRRHVPVPEDAAVTGDDLWSDKDGPGGWAVPPGVIEPGRTALSISGGGIRSATFALGVMQALARKNLLAQFDYMSTVSGGGYIGASVTWLTRPELSARNGLGPKDFPFGTATPRDRADPRHWSGILRFLREHGEYLIPGNGITVTSGIAAVVRGILLNLLVWLPILTAVFVVLLTGFHAPGLADLAQELMPPIYHTCATTDPASYMGCTESMRIAGASVPVEVDGETINWFELTYLAALFVLLVFGLVCVAYSIGTWVIRDGKFGYWGRHLFDARLKSLLPLGLVLLAFSLIPLLVQWLEGSLASAGALATLGGIASALSASGNSSRGLPVAVKAQLGAGLVLVGVELVACWWALQVHDGADVAICSFAILFLAALATGYFVNVNYVSLHRFYRDRLMEAFMPDERAVADNRTEPATGADRWHMHGAWNPGKSAEHSGSPYHVVNTNVVLVDSANRTYRTRGGDSFVVSPFYCGSDATGYQQTDRFMLGRMTLSTAMTISGAAVNPDTAVGGAGATRGRLLSWLLALLNIRLGYWVPHPKPVDREDPNRYLLRWMPPNHFVGATYEIWDGGQYREDRSWLQLSDGGHFENLGLYEMFRRRMRLIVVTDGGADPDYAFGDLRNALTRSAEDFGVSVTFGRPFWESASRSVHHVQGDGGWVSRDPGSTDDIERDQLLNRLSAVIPSRDIGYPPGVKVTDDGYIIGVIEYPAIGNAPAESGILIYVKATMIDGLSLETRGYKCDNPAFPHQSTLDQFFDDAQFEAYRDVGFSIGARMIEGARLGGLLKAVRGAPAATRRGGGAGRAKR
jgi:hypothetical protein